MGLKLKIEPTEFQDATYDEVASWSVNRVTMIETVDGGHDDVEDGNIYKMKLELNKTSGWANNLFVFCASTDIGGANTRQTRGFLIDSSLIVSQNSLGRGTSYDISNFGNQFLEVEFQTTIGTSLERRYIDYLKINGKTQIGTTFDTISSASSSSGISIGGGYTFWDSSSISNFEDGNIWDMRMESSLGVPLHRWLGYPDGSTLAGWEDTIGDIDAIQVNFSTETETIEGQDYVGDTGGNRLSIVPSADNKLLIQNI